MTPDQGGAALTYHGATNHTPESVRAVRRPLDWANQPRPYKIYPSLPVWRLPDPAPDSAAPALASIANRSAPARVAGVPSLAHLASILHYSAGITRRLISPGGEMVFRAAACTGALYHVDLYLVSGAIEGLEAGIYHYDPRDDGLRQLRVGDFRANLADACGDHPRVARAPVAIVYTSTYWRNAWKYQERAYRHAFWDSGTILANTLAVAAGNGLSAGVVAAFVDRAVNRLLGLNDRKEVALAVVPLGAVLGAALPPAPGLSPLDYRTVPYSASEGDYPPIRAVHTASSLATAENVRAWRTVRVDLPRGGVAGPEVQLQAQQDSLPTAPVEAVIRARGSTRRFRRAPISSGSLSTILATGTAPLESDFSYPGRSLTECFLLVNDVEGLAPGAYLYQAGSSQVELLREGEFLDAAGHLALDQDLGTDAAVNVYFLAHLPSVLGALGDRGYRAAQLEAAVMAGRMYLAAYALGLGATGLTFYDEEVTRFFGPRAAGRSPMFLIALGLGTRPQKYPVLRQVPVTAFLGKSIGRSLAFSAELLDL